jgi:hypothetical protein
VKATTVGWVLLEIMKLLIYCDYLMNTHRQIIANSEIKKESEHSNSHLFTVNRSSAETKVGTSLQN